MSEEEWATVWKRQLDTYYRPVNEPPPPLQEAGVREEPPRQAPTTPRHVPSPALAPRRGSKRPSSSRPTEITQEPEDIF